MWIQNVRGGGVESLAYAPDGHTLYTLDTGGWVTAWNTTSHKGERRFQLEAHETIAAFMQTVGDGRYFIFQPGRKLVIWDSETGEARRPRMPTTWGGFVPDPTHARVWCIERHQQAIRSWDLNRDCAPGPIVTGWPDDLHPTRIATGPNSVLALVGTEDRVVLFDWAKGTVAGDLLLDANYLYPQFSPEGDLLVLTGSGRVQVWDTRACAIRLASLDGTMAVGRMAFHPTEPVILTQGRDRSIGLYSLETGAVIRSLDVSMGNHVNCFAFAPDGLTCAVGGSRKQFVVFDVDL